jgi:hypothetical protein
VCFAYVFIKGSADRLCPRVVRDPQTDNTQYGAAQRQELFKWAADNPEAYKRELAICRDARFTLIGQFIQFLSMHLMIVACLCVVAMNWRAGRPSLLLFGRGQVEPFYLADEPEPDAETASRRSRTSSLRSKTPSAINDHLLVREPNCAAFWLKLVVRTSWCPQGPLLD